MAKLRFRTSWTDAPEGEAYGPEVPTWADLVIEVDGRPITAHIPNEPFRSDVAVRRPEINGPLSGLAEWLVDNFAAILWEFPVPFPKQEGLVGDRRAVPGLRAAKRWWQDVRDKVDVDLASLGVWQRHHTLGLTATQLALPSMVLVPEADRIGLFVDGIPDELDPTIRIAGSGEETEFWLDRLDLQSELVRFVEGVLERASEAPEARAWADWMRPRWARAAALESDPEHRRMLEFGPAVANDWNNRFATHASAATGLLSDLRALRSADELALVQTLVSSANSGADNAAWRAYRSHANTIGPLSPHEQGYRLAETVRDRMDLGDDPIDRLDIVLANLGIDEATVDSKALFRSAALVENKNAKIFVDQDVRGLAYQRSARTSALGRILSDSRMKSWGGAIGSHSRWIESRRATAFAAEFLAPAQVVRDRYLDAPDRLADDYGISRQAAEWRIHNARQQRRSGASA